MSYPQPSWSGGGGQQRTPGPRQYRGDRPWTPRGGYQGFRGDFRGGQQRTPRFQNRPYHQTTPNFNNPYANALTPRFQPRQQNRFRGPAIQTTGFGPCASGATPNTLAIIDRFVKPSMLDDPWRFLKEKNDEVIEEGESPLKKLKSPEVESKTTPSPESGDRQQDSSETAPEEEKEFNLRDFLPKF